MTSYRNVFFLIAISFSAFGVSGQDADDQARKTMNFGTLSDGISSSEIALYAKPPADAGIIGSPYLNDEWSKGSFMINPEKKYEVKALKLNVLNDYLEFNFEGGSRIINGDKIYRFSLLSEDNVTIRNFGRCNELAGPDESGFCQIVGGDKILLLKQFKAIAKEPNYNTALMTGEKAKKIIIQEVYILKESASSNYTIIKKRKDLDSFFKGIGLIPPKETNKVDVDKEGDLVSLVEKIY